MLPFILAEEFCNAADFQAWITLRGQKVLNMDK